MPAGAGHSPSEEARARSSGSSFPGRCGLTLRLPPFCTLVFARFGVKLDADVWSGSQAVPARIFFSPSASAHCRGTPDPTLAVRSARHPGRAGSDPAGPGPAPRGVRAGPRPARGHSGSGPNRARSDPVRSGPRGSLLRAVADAALPGSEGAGAAPVRIHSKGVTGGQAGQEEVLDWGLGCAAAGALRRCVACAPAGQRPISFAPCSALARLWAAGFVAGRSRRV